MLTVGKINYLNLFPIFYSLQKECNPLQFRFIEGTPAELNHQLREGTLDISPSSSIEFLRDPERYSLIDNHSISSTGPVMSILLFSKYPIEDLDKELVLASEQSETSTALLKIIMKKFYGLRTTIITSHSDLKDGLESASAYMLIGDDALKAARSSFVTDHSSPVSLYDLGEIWYRNTGLPFVFALWIGRKECCSEEDFLEFIDILNRAKEFAKENFYNIALDTAEKGIMSVDDLTSYWKNISYDLNDEHKEGMKLFDRYLKEEGLL